MTLTRQQLDDQLIDYLYEELEPGQIDAFEASMAAHPDLTAEVAAHRRTREAAAGLPSFAMPAGLFDGVLEAAALSAEAVHTAAASPHVPWWVKLHRLLAQPGFAAVMATVLLVGVGTVLLDRGPVGHPDDSPREEAPGLLRGEASAPAEAPTPVAATAEGDAALDGSTEAASVESEPEPDPLVGDAAPEDAASPGFGSAKLDVEPMAPPDEPAAAEVTDTKPAAKAGGNRRPTQRRPAPRAKRPAKPAAVGEVSVIEEKITDKAREPKAETRDGTTVEDRVAPTVTAPSTAPPKPAPKPTNAPRTPDAPSKSNPYRGVSDEGLDSAPARRALPEVPIGVPGSAPADDAGAERVDTDPDAAQIASLWRRYTAHVEAGRFAEADALLDRLERFPSQRTKAQSRRKQLVATRRAKRVKTDDGAKETLEQALPPSTQ